MTDLPLDPWLAVVSQGWGLIPRSARWVPPGFSGAAVARIETPSGPLALRIWPAEGPSPEQLDWIHAQQRHAAQTCPFVPRLIPTRTGKTRLRHAGRWCELATWQPGTADFRLQPTPQRLQAALAGLALVHEAWSHAPPRQEPCPAVLRRLDRLVGWTAADDTALAQRLALHPDPDQVALARQAWLLLRTHRATAQVRLSPWRNRPVPLQPCLTDVWSDHVLFVDDKLTGLVDFGGLRWDHVAVDLARLIGSLVDGDTQAWSLALAAYARHRRLEPATGDLARLLDRTGQLAAVATWLRTLVLEPRPLADPGRAWARLAQCTLRLTQDGV
ncbi:MAG TPA: phosphotransferase [Gemmatales bacterium]|nr:phosphotransferase [Gemmatales bacterium]